MQYSPEQIKALHQKYAPSDAVFELVYTHCQIVLDIAEQLMAAKDCRVDADVVRAGCMLHDIGVYPLFNADGTLKDGVHYITHGIEGEKILKAENMPESLWRIASHHTGVGLSKQDIEESKLPLPPADYFADTNEEALVMYADKFHSKTTPPYFNSFETYKEMVGKFGAQKAVLFEELAGRFGIPDLRPLQQKYGYDIR